MWAIELDSLVSDRIEYVFAMGLGFDLGVDLFYRLFRR